ncbi:MAG: 3-dehydroquinate synthase [Chloroflexi bacterium]|nr:3-dehydroquinate synthase [Chloroflexota bacterium]
MSNWKLIITGFMGTGKTTLSRLVAAETGLPLVDTDSIIIERTGRSIPELFAEIGEAGFRAWEATICAELAADEQEMIVSTGGGTLLPLANRQVLAPNAVFICLNAAPDIIIERLADQTDRPLLARADQRERVESLLRERQPIYSLFRWQIDTSQAAPEALVSQIVEIWERSRRLRAREHLIHSPQQSYPMLIEHGVLGHLSELLEVYGLGGRRIVIGTDEVVARLYGHHLTTTLPNAALVTMPSGETFKNLDTVRQLYGHLARLHLDRHGVVIALGGGVVGDTFGYAAATYMRGVRFVQIPTTLLAMVDSSVGGKVGVDTEVGKNLVGAFKQPDLVVIDPDVLTSLPEEEFSAGMAEVIKHALLADPSLLDKDRPLAERIRAAVQVKINVVQRDPYEQGERMHLNLGHTFAHAIERVSGYVWRHGDAVGLGLVAAGNLSVRLGLLDPETAQTIEDVVREAHLPTRYRHLSPESLWEAMRTDKKWRDGRSHFVVLRGLGSPDMADDVPRETVLAVLEELREL